MGGGLCGCGGLSGGGGSGGNDGGGGNAGGGVNVYVNCPLQKQQATNGVTPTAYNRSSVRMRKTELHWTLVYCACRLAHVTLVGAVCPDRSRFANQNAASSHSRTMMPGGLGGGAVAMASAAGATATAGDAVPAGGVAAAAAAADAVAATAAATAPRQTWPRCPG